MTPRTESQPPEGAFGKRFEIKRQLGAGGMGIVYEAIDLVSGERVALKTLTRLSGNELYRFKNEFRSLREVVHPNLVRLGELHGADERWFFTMELVDGVDLLRHLRGGGARPSMPSPSNPLSGGNRGTSTGRSDSSSGNHGADVSDDDPTPGPRPSSMLPRPLDEEPPTLLAAGRARPAPSLFPTGSASSVSGVNAVSRDVRGFGPSSWDEVRAAMRKLAGALGGLHAHGKIHRDLKPSNVMVTADGRVVVLDFGLVTEATTDDDDASRDDFVGTIAYMAPEQAMGRAVGPAADFYALGATLYRVLTGKVPFDGPAAVVLARKQAERPLDPRTFDPDVPDDLAALCLDLLDPDPERRPTEQQVAVRLGDLSGATHDAITAGAHGYVGHAAELAALEALADEVIDEGAMRAALIYGEAGSGRSALLAQFVDVERARRRGVVVLRSRCRAEEALPFKAFDGLVDALSQELRRASPSRIERWLPRDIEYAANVFPVLRRVPALAESGTLGANLPPAERRARAFDALRGVFAQIASERLVIVIITDLEWTDADSVAELDRMFRGEGAPRVLLVGTREVTEDALGEDLRRIGFPSKTSAFRLSPLDDAEANALAERLHPDLDPLLRRQFVRAAGGQPGTLVDMLHFARRTEGDRARTLSELVARRLAALGEAARALVELTAIAGFPLRESVAAGTLGVSQEAVRIAASELVTERMARLERRRGSTHLECASALVRNVVLDALDDEAQRALRVALVESLSRDRKSVERPELAVAHLVALGRHEEASLRIEAAADEAAALLAFERAAELYEQTLGFDGLDIERRRRVHERAGRCHAWSGRLPEAASAIAHAARLAPVGIERAELFARAGEIYASAYDADRMKPVVREGFAALGRRYPDTTWKVVVRIVGYGLGLALLPLLRRIRGRQNEPERRVLQSLYLSIQIGGYVSHDLAMATLGSLAAIYQGGWALTGLPRVTASWTQAVVYAGAGLVRAMRRAAQDAIDTAERADDDTARGTAAFGATVAYTKVNAYEEAVAHAERGLTYGAFMGAFEYVGMCTRIGMMLGLIGHVQQALVWYERAFSRIRSDVDNRFIGTCRDVRELLFAIAGKPGEGEAHFARFVASGDFDNGRGQIGIGIGLFFCHEADVSGPLVDRLLEAHEHTRVGARHPADEELPQYVGAAYVHARRAREGAPGAVADLERAIGRMRPIVKWRTYAAHLPVLEASCALVRGDAEAALVMLERAEHLAIRDDHTSALFETYLVRARAHTALGKPLHARLAKVAAETLARELGWFGRLERIAKS